MNAQSIQTNVRIFLESELTMIKNGQNVQDSIHSLQLWLCPFLSLMENEKDRVSFINEIIFDVKDFRLINKYKNIYGITVHCDDHCRALTDVVLSYLYHKTNLERIAS